MKSKCSIDEVSRALLDAKSFVIVSHYNPDADAYGSSLGFYNALTEIGKSVSICNESGQIPRYRSLAGFSEITNIPTKDGEVLLICDCGSYSRVGDTLKEKLKQFKTTINIDHHVSNEYYANMNYVDVTSSSTSEMVYDILSHAGIKISSNTANCLVAGIIGDTGSFQYSCATQKTFHVTEKLMSFGASPSNVSRALYGSSPLSAVKLHAQAILDSNFHFDGRFAEIVVTADMLSKFGSSMDDTEGLVEKARDIEGVLVSASYREDGPLWRVSLRSVSDKYNVSDVAATFGGGGHKVAAAFRSTKSLDVVQDKLRAQIKEILK